MPICAYFLLCWLEFLIENKSWHWVRSLCLGLCFGIMFWAKYTLLYFVLVPMIIWLILNLKRHQYRTLIINLLCILAGIVIITTPVLIFYAVHHAVDDLFYVYFWINLTRYNQLEALIYFPTIIFDYFTQFLTIGPVVLFLLFYGVITFTIRYWQQSKLLLPTSFIISFIIILITGQGNMHYFRMLLPYTILGLIDIFERIKDKKNINLNKKSFILLSLFCIAITIPISIFPYEIHRSKEDYTPLIIANVIQDYEEKNNTKVSLFSYKIDDFGFYNTTETIPNNYFYAKNYLTYDHFPEMYHSFQSMITNQKCDFVITQLSTYFTEQDFISKYYTPYTGEIESSTYQYLMMRYHTYLEYDFILLIRK